MNFAIIHSLDKRRCNTRFEVLKRRHRSLWNIFPNKLPQKRPNFHYIVHSKHFFFHFFHLFHFLFIVVGTESRLCTHWEQLGATFRSSFSSIAHNKITSSTDSTTFFSSVTKVSLSVKTYAAYDGRTIKNIACINSRTDWPIKRFDFLTLDGRRQIKLCFRRLSKTRFLSCLISIIRKNPYIVSHSTHVSLRDTLSQRLLAGR